MMQGSDPSVRGDQPPDPHGFRRALARFLNGWVPILIPERQTDDLKRSLSHLATRFVAAMESLIGPVRLAVLAGLALAVALAAVFAAAIAAVVLMWSGLIPSHLSHVAVIFRVLPPVGVLTLISGAGAVRRVRRKRDRGPRRGRHRRR